MIPPVLLDNSAWARLNDAGLSENRKRELGEAAESLRFMVCLPFLLEAGFSARDAVEHNALMRRLLVMPHVEIDAEVEERAIDVQSQLASVGRHRVPPSDVLIAVLGDRHGIGVLHYDRHYDLLAEQTDLTFESVWLAESGSL